MPKVKEIFTIMNEIAPPSLAEEWDSIGLQVGDPENKATGIMVALDASLGALCKAFDAGLNVLITHHPLLFKGISSINLSTYPGNIIKEAVRKEINIFSAHTNLDSASGGINDILADLLGLTESSPLIPSNSAENATTGIGRIGLLDKEKSLKEVASIVKEKLGLDKVKVLGDISRNILRISLCGGSGGSLISMAAEKGSDLFISGDISYHQAREAEELGIALIDAGHFSSERIGVTSLVKRIGRELGEKGITIPVEGFKGEEEPFALI